MTYTLAGDWMQGSMNRARIASRCGGLLCALALVWTPTALAGSLNTFTVNQTGDASDAALGDGPNVCDVDLLTGGNQCTLRAAIEESNATPADHDFIAFNIPGDGRAHDQPLPGCRTLWIRSTVDRPSPSPVPRVRHSSQSASRWTRCC